MSYALTGGGIPPSWAVAGQPLAAPGGERIGSLCLLDTRPRTLSADERTLLQEMAGWVERELALQSELDRAAQVQQVLMPRTAPRVDGYEPAGRCVSTQAISGDFFAWHLLDDEQLQLHVADVMGKGIPAALIAASVRAMLVGASQFNDQHKAFARVAVASQELLAETGAFVTAFSARLDPATGRVQYVDAGHGLAFVFSADGYRRLARSGPPLGVFPDDVWDLHSTVLEPGETLVVVSDGFLDFLPSLEETLDRAVGAEIHGLPVAELVDRAVAFARVQGRPDDVTVVALRRAAPDAVRAWAGAPGQSHLGSRTWAVVPERPRRTSPRDLTAGPHRGTSRKRNLVRTMAHSSPRTTT
ncbi:PP2C family protein-serine/threonine phosphatase [Kocuria aegyptia]|uniref:PPM-type phosphatase domain-containing protein n=1 Tax=Kocuria aegyptia TaxID=330943 RepID=A0ABN2K5R5_9MICC